MTINEALNMTPEQIARARAKQRMIAHLEQIVDFLDEMRDDQFLSEDTERDLTTAAVGLRRDILKAAQEPIQ